jgi:hypothetical protein
MRLAIPLVLLCSLAAAAGADVVTLTNGDRVSGRVVSRTAKRVRLQTPYGVLVIPREAVGQITRDDGSVEVVSAPPAPAPAPPPPPPPREPARLHLVVAGDSFWQAWDPKSAPPDPSLRLQLRLDDRELASYTDATLDPEDLPKAVVNSFVFSPEALAIRVAEGVVAGPPVVVPGEIGLPLKLPADLAGTHRLALAYQVNEGTASAPQWRDVVSASDDVELEAGRAAALRLVQGRGTMEYRGRRMRNVETFAATLLPQPSATPAP